MSVTPDIEAVTQNKWTAATFSKSKFGGNDAVNP